MDASSTGNAGGGGGNDNPEEGTVLDDYCVGTTLWRTYANGQGGSYNSPVQENHPDCGGTSDPDPDPNPSCPAARLCPDDSCCPENQTCITVKGYSSCFSE